MGASHASFLIQHTPSCRSVLVLLDHFSSILSVGNALKIRLIYLIVMNVMLRKIFNTLFHCIFHRVHNTELHKRLSLPHRSNVSATFQFTASLFLDSSTSTFPFFRKKEPVYRIPVYYHLTDIPLKNLKKKKYPLNCGCALYCF